MKRLFVCKSRRCYRSRLIIKLFALFTALIAFNANAQIIDRSLVRYYSVSFSKAPILDRSLAYRSRNGQLPSGETQKQWKLEILNQHNKFISILPEGVHVASQLYVTSNTINLLSTIGNLNIGALKAAARDATVPAATDSNTGLPGVLVPKSNSHAISVAFMDDGVDYVHVELGGSGTGYASNDPNVLEPGNLPNSIIAGGIDLIGDRFNQNSSILEELLPQPDPDPINISRVHGTQVAKAIANGAMLSPASNDNSIEIYAIKARTQSSRGYASTQVEGVEWVLDPNGDGDLSDHIDIFSLSLGSGVELFRQSLEKMADYGVLLAFSAGNGGDSPYNMNPLAAGENTMAIAASLGHNNEFVPSGSPDGSLAFNALLAPLGHQNSAEITAQSVFLPMDGCEVSEDITNKVVYIPNNYSFPAGAQCQHTDLAVRFRNLGALALVVVEVPDLRFRGILPPAEVSIPLLASDISRDEIPAQTKLHFNQRFIDENRRGLASFSARGPAHGTFRPNVAAPGVNVYLPHRGSGNLLRSSRGTSFSAPFAAGALAALIYQFPDDSLEAIQARLMNYADPLYDNAAELVPIARQGLGEVNLTKSLAASSLAYPAGLSFGFSSLSEFKRLVKTLTLENRSNTARLYQLTPIGGQEPDGVYMEFPGAVWVPANSAQTIEIALHVNPFAMDHSTGSSNLEFGQLIELSNPDIEPFHIGLQAVVEAKPTVIASRNNTSISIYNQSQEAVIASAFPKLEPLTEIRNEFSPDLAAYVSDVNGINTLRFAMGFPQLWDSPNRVVPFIDFETNNGGTTNTFRLQIGNRQAILRTPNGTVPVELNVDFNSRVMQFELPLLGPGFDLNNANVTFQSIDSITGLHFRNIVTISTFNINQLPVLQEPPYLQNVAPYNSLSFASNGSNDWYWVVPKANEEMNALFTGQ